MNQPILHHIGLQCHERKSFSCFYENVCGCQLVKTFTLSDELHRNIFGGNDEVEVVVYENDYFRFELFLVDKKHQRGCAHLCIEVDDREEFAVCCKQNDISISWIQKNGKQLLFVRDFSGNVFEVKQKQDRN